MLFSYNEDGTLEVLADVEEARRHFEAEDVDAGVVRFFDEAGKPLTARFPHRADRKVLGMRVSTDPGPFDLEAADADAETLQQALGPTVVLMPNPFFADVDAVRAHLARS